ncbi:MAG: hypothetical protein R3362_08495 [Rhodothermales bacterium]|nr:hypothetical protein [Rhodothermales bacterium]
MPARSTLLRSALLVLAVALGVARPADAQVREGLRELKAAGSLTVFEGDATLFVDGTLGFFLTDRVEVGPLVGVTSDFDNFTAIGLGGFVDYHLGRPGATTVPFVGAQVVLGLADADGFSIGGQGGLKYFVAPGAAVTPSAFLRVDDDSNLVFGAQFGVSLFF